MRYRLINKLIITIFVCCSKIGAYRPDNQPYTEDGLPQLFNIENYEECARKDGTLCKVNIVIKAHDPNSKLANKIEMSKKFNNLFERQFIHRLICFTNDTLGDSLRMREYSERVAYRELQLNNFNKDDVDLTVTDFHCSGGYPVNFLDYLFWVIVPLYFCLIFKSTIYDLKKRKIPAYPTSKYEKLYNIFAIRRNWEKVMKASKSQDFERLKCIQGLRFYITTMMIINHTKLSYGPLYFRNPVDFEMICAHPFFYGQVIFDMLFIIQSYFMISSFLMTNQMLEIKKKHGHVSLYHCFVLYLNRICRFLISVEFKGNVVAKEQEEGKGRLKLGKKWWYIIYGRPLRFFPSVLVMVLITMCGPKLVTVGPHVNEFIFAIQKSCRNSWWTPILQLGFLKKFEDMCVPGSWYMSVDTLFYLTGMLIIYLHLKYNLNLNKILAVVFTIFSVMFAFTIHANDFPVMFRINTDVFTNLYNSPEFNKLYISPLSSYTTMCVGVWFGALYFHTKNRQHQMNTFQKLLWISSMIISLPLLVILSDMDYEGLIRSVIGPFVKPAFAGWTALLIVGLSRKQGGIFNQIFEWDFAIKMGNFTFSTYIFHFFLVFQRGALDTELFVFKSSNLVFVTVFNVVASFVLGTFCSLILEQPFATLQKMYLPQIKDPTKPKDTDEGRHNGVEKIKLIKGCKAE